MNSSMNQFFDARRFGLLVAKHWTDNRKRYGLSVLAFIGLLTAWFVFTQLTELDDPMSANIQQATFLFCLFVVGSFYASQYFRDLGSRPKGINFLLVPASTFEKILCSLLYTVILFTVVFTAAFYLVDVLMVAIANGITTSGEGASRAPVINLFTLILLPLGDGSSVNVLLVFFSVQSVFLLGSVYFARYGLLKTIITGFALFFLFFCLLYFFYEKLLPGGEATNAYLTAFQLEVEGPADHHLVRAPEWMGKLLHYMVLYAAAPFFWMVTYFRLKEKQV